MMNANAGQGRCSGGVPPSRAGAPSHCPLSYVDCRESYPAFGAPAGGYLIRVKTRERDLYDGHRPIHGGAGGGSGHGRPNVRETVVVKGKRPFDRSGLGPPRNQIRLRADETGTYPRLGKSLKIDPRRRPQPRSLANLERSAGGEARNRTAAR